MADHYATLGVARNASLDQIKHAYRRLARDLHPDVAGESGAEQFKEISRAYEVLSDPKKREMYDLGVDPTAPGGGMPTGPGAFGQFGFQDIFETFFGAQPTRGPTPRVRRGQDSLVRLNIDLAEAVFGAAREVEVDPAVVCATCKGSGCQVGTSPDVCATCSGSGQVQRLVRSFLGQVLTTATCPECGGLGETIAHPCPQCHGEGRVRERRVVPVTVPAGVDSGRRIQLAGQGDVGPGGGPAGDLYVEIRVRAHPMFTRRGDNLHCTIQVPMTAAALGTVLRLETVDGPREVPLQPGTQPGALVTVRGLGVGKSRGGRGDLVVKVEVAVPKPSSEAEIALLQELAALRGEERPLAPNATGGKGALGKLKDKILGG